MALQLSAIDAVVGGIATAFFGGLLASGAYLLKHVLSLQGELAALRGEVEALRIAQAPIGAFGQMATFRNPEEEESPGGQG